jgi:Domain of unknown function (DUF4091)
MKTFRFGALNPVSAEFRSGSPERARSFMNRLLLISLLLLLAVPTHAFAQDPLAPSNMPSIDCSAADYPANIWITGPLVKVRQDTGSPASTPCITVYATQNEIQSFQVHVQAPSGGIPNLNVTMSDLVNSKTNTHISASSTDIVVYREMYMDVTIKTGTSVTFYNSTGFYPDALLPAVDPYYHQKTNAFPFNVAGGNNQSAWIDVHVPASAPSGYYLGTATISSGGTTLATMPVVYAIWQWPASSGGQMPSTATLQSFTGGSYDGGCIQMFGSLTACNYGGQTGDSATTLVQQDTVTLLLDNRYSNGGQTNSFPCNAGSCGSFATWDSHYAPFFNGTNDHVTGILQGAKLTSYSISLLGSLSSNGPTFTAFQNHFSTNGWGNKLFYYLCDEPPNGCSFATLVSNGNTEHSSTSPVVPNLVTTDYTSANTNSALNAIDWLVPAINVLENPTNGLQNLTNYLNWVAAEPTVREWWSYQACSSAGTCGNGTVGSAATWPNYDIDGQPVANRAMEWLTFFHGQTAELYYFIDVCAQTGSGPAAQCGVYSGGPSTSPQNPIVSDYYSGGWGDGTLIYYSGTAYNAGTTIPLILPSMRLKMIRDGMQDYEYLHLLTSQGKGSFVTTEIKSWITNSYTFNVNPSGLSSARQALGQATHQLTYPLVLQPPPGLAGTVH